MDVSVESLKEIQEKFQSSTEAEGNLSLPLDTVFWKI